MAAAPPAAVRRESSRAEIAEIAESMEGVEGVEIGPARDQYPDPHAINSGPGARKWNRGSTEIYLQLDGRIAP